LGLKVLAIALLLTGCAGKYASVEPGVYQAAVLIVEDATATSEWCNGAVVGQGCVKMLNGVCWIVLPAHGWDRKNNHEWAHCFGAISND